MTLLSIVVVLGIKSYTINAQDRPMNDGDLEILAGIELLNKADTMRHQKMIDRFVKSIEESEFFYGKSVGLTDFPNEVYEDYEHVQRVGTKEELSKLMRHESPIVRLYAQKAMSVNHMQMDPEALEALSNDTTMVLVKNGTDILQVPVMQLASENLFVWSVE